MYSELTVHMASCVWGFLIVVNYGRDTLVKAQMMQQLEELVEDTDLYGWARVHAFHVAWLNQIEQGRST